MVVPNKLMIVVVLLSAQTQYAGDNVKRTAPSLQVTAKMLDFLKHANGGQSLAVQKRVKFSGDLTSNETFFIKLGTKDTGLTLEQEVSAFLFNLYPGEDPESYLNIKPISEFEVNKKRKW